MVCSVATVQNDTGMQCLRIEGSMRRSGLQKVFMREEPIGIVPACLSHRSEVYSLVNACMFGQRIFTGARCFSAAQAEWYFKGKEAMVSGMCRAQP